MSIISDFFKQFKTVKPLKPFKMKNLITDIIADGFIDAVGVEQLKKKFLTDGVIDREGADALFAINTAVSGNDNHSSYPRFFIESISLQDSYSDLSEIARDLLISCSIVPRNIGKVSTLGIFIVFFMKNNLLQYSKSVRSVTYNFNLILRDFACSNSCSYLLWMLGIFSLRKLTLFL